MEPLNGIVRRVLQKRGLQTQATASHAVFAATKILQEYSAELAADCHIQKLQDGVLLLETKTSSAAQACRDIAPILEQRLKKELGMTVEVRIAREITK